VGGSGWVAVDFGVFLGCFWASGGHSEHFGGSMVGNGGFKPRKSMCLWLKCLEMAVLGVKTSFLY
jgi:hypothetical protein